MPYKAYYLNPSGELKQNLSEEDIGAAFVSKQGLLWVDVSETTHEDGDFLTRVFNFHPLAVQATVDPVVHSPTIMDFTDYRFLILRGINYTVESHIIETTELDLFLGPNYVISNHNVFLYSIDAMRVLVEKDSGPMRRGPEFLTYAIIGSLIDNITPSVDGLAERVDDIEDEIFHNINESALEAINAVKRSCLRLRRAIAPQREVLNQLSRHELGYISQEFQLYFRDIYDMIARLEGYNENLRERADTAISMYLSIVANRQNETMRTLAIVAAIFLPLGLLAGIYGMNFAYIPELEFRWGYFVVIGFMVTVIIITLWTFWLHRWVTSGRRRLEAFIPAAVDRRKLTSYFERRVMRHRL